MYNKSIYYKTKHTTQTQTKTKHVVRTTALRAAPPPPSTKPDIGGRPPGQVTPTGRTHPVPVVTPVITHPKE